jgi:radical SAM protein with 4Fe4S-binding SPASM domain
VKTFFPFLLQTDITSRCNLHCAYCRTTFGAKDECSTSQWLAILDNVLSRSPYAIQWLAIGGGEPTLRMQTLQAIAERAARSVRVILVMTNGVTIAERPEILSELKQSGINRVQVSLDSPTADIHDQIRGNGAFNKAVAALEICRSEGVSSAIRMTVNQYNKDQCEELVRLGVSLGADEINFRRVIPIGNAKEDFPVDCLSKDEHRAVLESFPELSKKYGVFINSEEPLHYIVDPKFARLASCNGEIKRGCPAGVSHSYIDPAGRMRPCSNIPYVLGDLRKEDFWEIWHNHPWLARFRMRDFEKCQQCDYRNICGGCRAMAKVGSGDWWGVDPTCWV